MRTRIILGLLALNLIANGEANAQCETVPAPVHGEVTQHGVRYEATAGGLRITELKTGEQTVQTACDGLAGTYLQAIATAPGGGLTLAVQGRGLWTFDPKSGAHDQLLEDPRLRWPTAMTWFHDQLWVGTVQHGLWRIDLSHATPRLSQPVRRFRAKRVTGLAVGPQGGLLVGRDLGGLWRIDDAGRSKRMLRGSVQGLSVIDDRVIVDQGAQRCLLSGRRRCHPIRALRTEASDDVDTGALPNDHITTLAIHPGPEGAPRLWAGTFDAGVIWRDASGRWRRPTATGESPRLVNTLTSDGERLWAATATGAFCLENGAWRRIGELSGLASDHVNAVHVSEDGAVWFATSAGLTRWGDDGMHTWNAESGLPYRIVYSVATYQGRVLAGTSYGVGVMEGDTWTSVRMGASGLSDDWVNAVAFRADGTALVGTYDAGVNTLSESGVQQVHGLGSVWVNPSGLFPVDALGGVFVATLGDGLWFWPDGGEPRRYRQGSHLPSRDVTSVLVFGDALWVGTRNGLAQWPITTGQER
jgi:ligand-binding sensor domain-containing protein